MAGRIAFRRVSGIVYLVGAGPGDPGLMTRRSLELIASADAILYDRLIPPGALDGARPDAELRYVGKEPGAAALTQEETNELLVELGRAGKRVVRLKGGDPFVFGRGGEEAEALAAAGVPFEVVPGVTAGVAAPAYAGIPVTHRDAASAVAFVTGHEDPEKAGDRARLGRARALPRHARLLHGDQEPAADRGAPDRGGARPGRARRGGRARHASRASAPSSTRSRRSPRVWRRRRSGRRRSRWSAPWPSCARRSRWLERRPLHGEVVAVTRARAQASGLAARLRELGAEVVETPAIRIEPRPVEGELRAAIDRIDEYALICFTSPNGVRLFFDALGASGGRRRRVRSPGRRPWRPSGRAPPRSWRARDPRRTSSRSASSPRRSSRRSRPVEVEGRRVLVARAAEARAVLPDALRERGAEVDDVALYDTVAEPLAEAAARAASSAPPT